MDYYKIDDRNAPLREVTRRYPYRCKLRLIREEQKMINMHTYHVYIYICIDWSEHASELNCVMINAEAVALTQQRRKENLCQHNSAWRRDIRINAFIYESRGALHQHAELTIASRAIVAYS